MKALIFSLLIVGNVANASVMLKCKSTASVLAIQFDEASDPSQPRNLQATITNKNKTTDLSLLASEDEHEGFFLNDAKTKRNFYVSRKASKGAYSVQCTEQKALGLMLLCEESFACKKVTSL